MAGSPNDMLEAWIADYDRGVEAIKRYGKGNVTYSPRIGRCICLNIPRDRDVFFDEFSDGGSPVYIIGVTDNDGDFDEARRDAYVSMRSRGVEAMLGQ